MVNMALGHTAQTKTWIQRQFQRGLQILLNTFHDTILLYKQNIQIVNFSDITQGFVNIIITYETTEGRSVKLEAIGEVSNTYVHTLNFIWQAMQKAAQEALSDYSGPFASLTLPTQNDLFKVLPDLLM